MNAHYFTPKNESTVRLGNYFWIRKRQTLTLEETLENCPDKKDLDNKKKKNILPLKTSIIETIIFIQAAVFCQTNFFSILYAKRDSGTKNWRLKNIPNLENSETFLTKKRQSWNFWWHIWKFIHFFFYFGTISNLCRDGSIILRFEAKYQQSHFFL